MASTSSQASKPSLSSLGYRQRQLAPAGIYFDRTSWWEAPTAIVELLVNIRNFTATVPPGTPVAEMHVACGSVSMLAEPGNQAAQIKYSKAVEVRRLATSVRDRPEARWTEVILSECEVFRSAGSLDYMQDLPWYDHPVARAKDLPSPKPDFAVGYQLLETGANADWANLPIFSEGIFDALRSKPGLYLQPHPNRRSQPSLVYPFFCFEAKSPVGTSYAAGNQLANCLAFALGLMYQLRQDQAPLLPVQTHEPLIAFGATSSGADWTAYVAYEGGIGLPHMECHVARFWSGNIMDVDKALEFLYIVERIKLWATTRLQPQLETWLRALYTQ